MAKETKPLFGPLSGKSCVVTGATSGIGLATAAAARRLWSLSEEIIDASGQ